MWLAENHLHRPSTLTLMVWRSRARERQEEGWKGERGSSLVSQRGACRGREGAGMSKEWRSGRRKNRRAAGRKDKPCGWIISSDDPVMY